LAPYCLKKNILKIILKIKKNHIIQTDLYNIGPVFSLTGRRVRVGVPRREAGEAFAEVRLLHREGRDGPARAAAARDAGQRRARNAAQDPGQRSVPSFGQFLNQISCSELHPWVPTLSKNDPL
jgi:hypothetical protein